MRLSFKTRKLQQALTTDKGLAKSFGTLAKKVKKRMQQLESADDLYTISLLPALRLHQQLLIK
jgi:toxin HigB-1